MTTTLEETLPTRTCSKCGNDKPLSEFGKGRAQCKQCLRDYTRAWRAGEHRTGLSEANKVFFAKFTARIRAQRTSPTANMSNAQLKAYHLAHAQLRNLKPQIRQIYDNFVLAGCTDDSLMRVLAVLAEVNKEIAA